MFWTALGLGAGVAGAIMMSRWVRRQKQRYSPANLSAQLSEGARDLGSLFQEALDEGRQAMAEREAEIRASLPD
ncbi:MAG TPA: hypothetical protein VGB28_00980 [Actinomycetota bacterium]|jgi:hypothetical protein